MSEHATDPPTHPHQKQCFWDNSFCSTCGAVDAHEKCLKCKLLPKQVEDGGG